MEINDQRVQARALYAQGAKVDEIADALGKTPKTIYRWRALDKKAGHGWDQLRQERTRVDPHVLLGLLEDRRYAIAAQTEGKIDTGAWADALYKIERVIDSIRKRIGDIGTQLAVLAEFAEYCMGHLTDDDMAVVRRAVSRYMEHLRSGDTGQ